MIPKIADLCSILKTKQAPRKGRICNRGVHIKDSNVVLAMTKIRGPDFEVAVEQLGRRHTRLLDCKHLIVGCSLLAKTIEFREIAAKINRRIRQCPQ